MKRALSDAEGPGFAPYLQSRRIEPSQHVNIIPLMLQAARTQIPPSPNIKGTKQSCPVFGHNFIPCTHCGKHQPETHLQQCSHCCDIFCATCSIMNYDTHEDRVFCLDCDSSAAGSSGSQGSPIINGGSLQGGCGSFFGVHKA